MRVLMAATLKFFAKSNIFFERSFVPEVDFVEAGGELFQVIRFVNDAVAFSMNGGYFLAGAGSVE